jgi:hypothetical protein
MLDLFGVTEANWRDHIARDPHWSESETPLFAGRCIAALAADPQHWRANGTALASWDLAEQYGIDDVDGRRPHWGRYIAAHVDAKWDELVAATRNEFEGRAPGVDVAAERATLTLRAGGATRSVLEPELFFSSSASIASELYARYERAARP